MSAPLVLIRRARATGVWPRYLRLVRRQLLVVLFVMAALSPGLLAGVELAATRPHTEIELTGTHVKVVRISRKPEHKKPPKHDEDDDAGNDEPSTIKVAGSSFFSQHAPRLLPTWIALVSIYGTWIVIEWIISALSNEHTDALTDALATSLGLPVWKSERDRPPRIRLDARWMFRRLKRQLAAAIVFASGAPLFLLAKLIPRAGEFLCTATITAWGLYWLLVTTAGKSDFAWSTVATQKPWFLRAWTFLVTRVPGFRWWLPRTYGRIWSWLTEKLHRAAQLLEEAPWGYFGLSLVRILGNLPVFSILVRPLLPVAATLIAERSHAKSLGEARRLS